MREPFSLWATVARQTRHILLLAVALENEDVDALRELVAPWLDRLPIDSPRDTLGQASHLVEGLLNDGLHDVRERVVSGVRVTQGAWRRPRRGCSSNRSSTR